MELKYFLAILIIKALEANAQEVGGTSRSIPIKVYGGGGAGELKNINLFLPPDYEKAMSITFTITLLFGVQNNQSSVNVTLSQEHEKQENDKPKHEKQENDKPKHEKQENGKPKHEKQENDKLKHEKQENGKPKHEKQENDKPKHEKQENDKSKHEKQENDKSKLENHQDERTEAFKEHPKHSKLSPGGGKKEDESILDHFESLEKEESGQETPRFHEKISEKPNPVTRTRAEGTQVETLGQGNQKSRGNCTCREDTDQDEEEKSQEKEDKDQEKEGQGHEEEGKGPKIDRLADTGGEAARRKGILAPIGQASNLVPNVVIPAVSVAGAVAGLAAVAFIVRRRNKKEPAADEESKIQLLGGTEPPQDDEDEDDDDGGGDGAADDGADRETVEYERQGDKDEFTPRREKE